MAKGKTISSSKPQTSMSLQYEKKQLEVENCDEWKEEQGWCYKHTRKWCENMAFVVFYESVAPVFGWWGKSYQIQAGIAAHLHLIICPSFQ